jgi:hypothetical protein
LAATEAVSTAAVPTATASVITTTSSLSVAAAGAVSEAAPAAEATASAAATAKASTIAAWSGRRVEASGAGRPRKHGFRVSAATKAATEATWPPSLDRTAALYVNQDAPIFDPNAVRYFVSSFRAFVSDKEEIQQRSINGHLNAT